MRPRKGTKTRKSGVLNHFTNLIYKDETPEGDENGLLDAYI